MDHERKRKSDEENALCTHSKRARLDIVSDSAASSRLPSPSATAQPSRLVKCSQQSSSADPASTGNYYSHIHHHNDHNDHVHDHVSASSSPSLQPSSNSTQTLPDIGIFPPISKEVLKELDLDVIIRHPQLRHDFLFDPSLQFRTMNGGRKQYLSDQYWEIVLRELEHALNSRRTRTRTRTHTHTHTHTRPPTPPPWSEKHYSAYLHAATQPNSSSSQAASMRRLPALLHTLTQVLSYVIGSVSSDRSLSISQVLSHIDVPFIDNEMRQGLYEPSGLFTLMGHLLKAHCAPMRDGKVDVMVAVARGDLNPSGLFGPPFSTSEFLPFTDAQRSIRRTIASLRLCFEILELMKLDIANHHLHHLRPFLVTSGPDFLHRVFIDKVQRGLTTLHNATAFFNDAYVNIMSYPRSPDSGEFSVATSTVHAMLANIIRDSDLSCGRATTSELLQNYPRGLKIHLAFIASLTDMIFNPPTFDSHICQCGLVVAMRNNSAKPKPTPLSSSSSSSSNNSEHVHEFKRHCSGGTTQLSWPETLWLDSNRIAQLIGDAADLTALYVLLMGWRMLVFAKPENTNGSSSSSPSSLSTVNDNVNLERDDSNAENSYYGYDRKEMPPLPSYTNKLTKSTQFKLNDWMIDDVKKEIWSIAPRKFGSCFFWDDYSCVNNNNNNNNHINSTSSDDSETDETRQAWKEGMENVALHIAMRAEDTPKRDSGHRDGQQSADPISPPFSRRHMPSHESVSLLLSWIDTHMRRSSTLTTRLRKLLATEVATTAAKMTLRMVSAGLGSSGSDSDRRRNQTSRNRDNNNYNPISSPLESLSSTTPTSALYNTLVFPDIRRGPVSSGSSVSSPPSLLTPHQTRMHSHHTNMSSSSSSSASSAARVRPPFTCSPSHHRPINIIPSPAAVSAGLEPLMPEIKHLASRIAKLTYVNMRIFWSLYTAPGFLSSSSTDYVDDDPNHCVQGLAGSTPERELELGIKTEED